MSKAVIASSAHNIIPYRKGVFQESARYNSLTILEMSKTDLDYALKTIIKKEITTGDRAKQFALKDLDKIERPHQSDWSYQMIDLHGRVGILKYKGIEIALFIKRQLSPHRITGDTPLSEKRLNNPDDAWMRLDLSGLSARQSKRPTLDYIRKLEEKIERLTYKNETLAAIVDQQGAKINRYEKRKRTAKKHRHSKDTERRHSKTKSRSRKGRR
jgi:hypothetical protein